MSLSSITAENGGGIVTIDQPQPARRYGNYDQFKEDAARCIREVWEPGGWHSGQCSRKRGHGPDALYCTQHGRIAQKRIAAELASQERQRLQQ